MRPQKILDLHRDVFGGELSCLGIQLVEILLAIDALYPDLRWYVADVQAVGVWPTPRRKAVPILIGDTKELIKVSARVDQFLSGVFSGVHSSVTEPDFREGGLWTEDEADADIGNALIEIRAFDTSYWSLASSDAALIADIVADLAGYAGTQ